MSQTASSGTTMTFRHMKIWKRLNGSGNDPVFRSPSSDSGYSDAQMFQTTGAGKGAKQLAPGRSQQQQQQQLKQRGGRGGGTAGDGEEVRRLGGSDMSDGANKRKLFGCCSSQEMLNFETVLGFVRRKDANRIQHALRDSHFDIDTQDAVSSNTYPHSLSLSLFVSLPYSCLSPCLHPLYLCTFCHSLLLLLHIFACLAMYLFLSICLSLSLYLFSAFSLSISLYLPVHVFSSLRPVLLYLYAYLFFSLPVSHYLCLPMSLPLSLPLCVSACLFVYPCAWCLCFHIVICSHMPNLISNLDYNKK